MAVVAGSFINVDNSDRFFGNYYISLCHIKHMLKPNIEYFEEVLKDEINEFYKLIEECELEEERNNEVNDPLYSKYCELKMDITIPEEYVRISVVGLAWSLANKYGWNTDYLIDDTGKKVKVNYNAFEEYLIKRFLPISIGFPKPTIYVWNGKQYVENKGHLEHAIKEVLKPYFTEKQIRSHMGEIMYRVQVSTISINPPFNKYNDLLPVKNGTLLLEPDYKLLPHSPAFLFTFSLNVEYDPDAECPNIDKFISEIVEGEDQKVLYEIPAICLLNERYHYAYMLYGSGSNGKSTYLNIVKTFLGNENVTSMTFQELCNNRFAVAELYGKLANICADIPADPVVYTGMFKMLTGGDMVKAEKKYRDPFTFVNRAKLIFSCNELPQTGDMTDAFWRRWIIVKFPKKFRRNEELLDKLLTKEELSGFLNRVLEARTRIMLKGVTITKTMEDIKNEWMSRANPVWGFVKDCLVEDPRGEVTKEGMYDAYREYCEEHDLRVVSKTKFAIELQKYIKVKSTRKRIRGELKRVWVGVRLVCNCKEDDIYTGVEDYEIDLSDF